MLRIINDWQVCIKNQFPAELMTPSCYSVVTKLNTKDKKGCLCEKFLQHIECSISITITYYGTKINWKVQLRVIPSLSPPSLSVYSNQGHSCYEQNMCSFSNIISHRNRLLLVKHLEHLGDTEWDNAQLLYWWHQPLQILL